jgi:carbonic anhydrase
MDNVLMSGFGKCDVYSPIDISDSHSLGKCIDKCDYSFDYKNSAIPITNKGDYLEIKYDDTSSSEAPVNYNTKTYKVTDIRIYSPSLHTYNGVKTDAEILIIHTPILGGKKLFVSVPIMSQDNSLNVGSKVLTEIVKSALANVPAEGNQSNVENVKNFNLNMIVPKKQYYYYSGVNFLEQPCSIPIDIICYLPYASNINISSILLTNFSTIIKPSDISPKPYSDGNTPRLYFNEQGSLKLGSDNDDVVMECQPYETTDEPTENVDVVIDTNLDNYNPMDIFKSSWFQVIAGSLAFFILLCVLNVLFGAFEHKTELTESAAAASGGFSLSSMFKKK